MNVDWSPLKDKAIMITGSTGFLGRNLRKSFEEAFSDSDDDCFWFFPLREYLDVHAVLPQVDYIIHAAGYASPSIFTKCPIDTIKVNTEVTIRLLEHLKPGGSFLFCSTSEIYKGLTHLCTESDIGTTTPQHERAAYIEGKRCGEAIVTAFRNKGVNAKIARISLAYGPGTKKHDARVLNQFIEMALTTGKIEPRDDGLAAPTYCYVDDTVEMLWNILLHGTQPVYNVGGINTLYLATLALIIGKMTGAEVSIPEGPAGQPQIHMSLNRYRNEFHKKDWISLDEGLRRTIQYQKELYGL